MNQPKPEIINKKMSTEIYHKIELNQIFNYTINSAQVYDYIIWYIDLKKYPIKIIPS